MDEKISPMERRTLNALDSANPFQTPIGRHVSLDGRPVQKAEKPEEKPKVEEQKKPQKKRVKAPQESIADVLARIEEPPVIEPTKPPKPPEPVPAIEPDPVAGAFENPITETHDRGGCPSYRTEFAGRDIFVGLPWYKTSNPVTTMALVAMALDFGKDQIRFDLVMGDAMVYHSRNRIVEQFMQTDAKWLFMLDDDIIPSIGRSGWYKAWVANARHSPDEPFRRHILHRLIGSGKTLVGGAYFGRQEGAPLMCSNTRLSEDARMHSDKVVPVDWVGTGAMLIHRKVFDAIREKFPELKSNNAQMPFDYFKPGDDGAGEDIAFCRRALAAGHQPHIDLGVPLAHVGYKAY